MFAWLAKIASQINCVSEIKTGVVRKKENSVLVP